MVVVLSLRMEWIGCPRMGCGWVLELCVLVVGVCIGDRVRSLRGVGGVRGGNSR